MGSMIERVRKAVYDVLLDQDLACEHDLYATRAALTEAKSIADELGQEKASVFLEAVLADGPDIRAVDMTTGLAVTQGNKRIELEDFYKPGDEE